MIFSKFLPQKISIETTKIAEFKNNPFCLALGLAGFEPGSYCIRSKALPTVELEVMNLWTILLAKGSIINKDSWIRT